MSHTVASSAGLQSLFFHQLVLSVFQFPRPGAGRRRHPQLGEEKGEDIGSFGDPFGEGGAHAAESGGTPGKITTWVAFGIRMDYEVLHEPERRQTASVHGPQPQGGCGSCIRGVGT